MTFILNNVDLSAYLQQKVGITETPRRISGNNSGVAIDGTLIDDYVTTKYDLTVRAKPMPAADILTLLTACAAQYVEITYTSVIASGSTRTINAVPSASTVQFLTAYAGGRIYGDLVLSFSER